MNVVEYHKVIEELKEIFPKLSIEQKKLLLCRKVIELANAKSIIEQELKDGNVSENELINLEKTIFHDIDMLANYCNCNKLALRFLYCMCERNNKLKKHFKSELISYNEVLNNYKQLADELGISASLDLSHFLSFMLKNGYFSSDKNYSFNKRNCLSIPGMYSFDVINGYGDDLSNAELLHNFLAVCGVKASIINGVYSDNGYNIFNTTLINDDGKIYTYNPISSVASNIESSKVSIENGNAEQILKPRETLFSYPNADLNSIYEELFNRYEKPIVSSSDVIDSDDSVNELLARNTNLLDDAYDSIYNKLITIKDGMEKKNPQLVKSL